MSKVIEDPHLPTVARAAAIGALRSVCGIEDVTVTPTSPKGGPRAETTYTADFTGWSPTLHRVRCYLHVNCDHRDPDLPETLAAAFTAALASQRRRLEAGIALGIVEPLPILIDAADDARTDHLLVDRALPAIATDGGEDACSELLEVLYATHGGDIEHDCGAVIEVEGGLISETPHGRVVGFRIDMGETPGGNEVSFDGLVLDIFKLTLPHSAMIALVGRPLSDLAVVHPALDHRVIVAIEPDAEQGPTGLRIALELDLVPYDSIK